MELGDYEEALTGYAVEVTKWLVARDVSVADAQDTVQDVFVKMLEMDLLIPPSKLRSWMYRVALRGYIDKYRRSVKYQAILSELTLELSALTEAPPDLTDFLAKLKPADSLLLRRYYYERLSVKELAQLTGASLSKVKVDLYRARKKLRKILESEGFEEWKI